MTAAGIYAIQRKDSDERYIGSAVNIGRRWSTHRHALRRGKHHSPRMQNVWNKHGEDVLEFVVLEAVEDKANLIEREQVWLDRGTFPAYNTAVTAGSNLGLKYTPEQSANLSAAKMGHICSDETKAKIGTANRGKKPSAEMRANMSAAHKGKKHSDETIARMSAAHTGKVRSDEHRANLSAANKGKRPTPETRAKQSVSAIRRCAVTRAKKAAELILNDNLLSKEHARGFT